MTITVCLGSSCHHKGSQKIIDFLRDFIKEQQLEEYWELKASFCLGECAAGINVTVDEERVAFPDVAEVIDYFRNFYTRK